MLPEVGNLVYGYTSTKFNTSVIRTDFDLAEFCDVFGGDKKRPFEVGMIDFLEVKIGGTANKFGFNTTLGTDGRELFEIGWFEPGAVGTRNKDWFNWEGPELFREFRSDKRMVFGGDGREIFNVFGVGTFVHKTTNV